MMKEHHKEVSYICTEILAFSQQEKWQSLTDNLQNEAIVLFYLSVLLLRRGISVSRIFQEDCELPGLRHKHA